MKSFYTIGLLSAMPEELGNTISKLDNVIKKNYGNLEIFSGNLIFSKLENINIKIIAAWSGWGKVNASYAATRLISEAEKQNLKMDFILFTGVAGAANLSINQWDVVIAESLIQHDMDASPIYEKFVIPGLNLAEIKMDKELQNWSFNSLKKFTDNLNNPFRKVHKGLIATGDQFIDGQKEMGLISKRFVELKAFEMEGAAVSQVCFLESIPLLIIRVISDSADHSAASTFEEFIVDYNNNSWDLIKSLILNIQDLP